MNLLENMMHGIGICCLLAAGSSFACSSEVEAPTYEPVNPTGVGSTATTGASTTGAATTGAATTGAATTTAGVANVTTSGTTTAGVANVTGTGTTAQVTSAGTTGFGVTATSTTGGAPSVCDTTLTGEQFFMQPMACARCHGADALGVAELGPAIRFPVEDYARWIIRNGRTDHPDFVAGMEGYAQDCLTDAQLDQILTFLNGFPRPTDGAGLFANFCASCHGPDGRGGVTGITLDAELHEIATITAEGANTGSYGEREEYMPVMVGTLSQAEIQLITDYLQNQLGLVF